MGGRSWCKFVSSAAHGAHMNAAHRDAAAILSKWLQPDEENDIPMWILIQAYIVASTIVMGAEDNPRAYPIEIVNRSRTALAEIRTWGLKHGTKAMISTFTEPDEPGNSNSIH